MTEPPLIQKDEYHFTLCFLFHQDNILMIERKKEPNLGMWNGVGGHIEIGESPLQSCIREIEEETGIVVPTLRFGGVLTWEEWTFERGGMYFFSAEVDSDLVRHSAEGDLAWKTYDWVMTSPAGVGNIPEFLPDLKTKHAPRRYHCLFNGVQLLETNRYPLPDWITPEWVQGGQYGV
jgi:8-oxo-dGTP diphosphatase